MDSTDQFKAMTYSERAMPKTKARSRTISENILGKNHNYPLKSPPSSLSNSRSRLHSPSHLPYTIRSPRTMSNVTKQQYQASSPINIDSSSVSRSSGKNRHLKKGLISIKSLLGFHSSFMSPSSSVPSSFNENPIDLSHHPHIPVLPHSPKFSSSLHNPSTMPIQIPSANTAIPPASLSHLTGIFPITQSHSLPTYFLPQTNLAYFIANSNQNSTQPIHILTPFDSHSVHFPRTRYSTASYPPGTAINDSPHKPHQSMETNKQFEEQLPLKKRRYTGQQPSGHSPMDINHDDDDDASNESIKK